MLTHRFKIKAKRTPGLLHLTHPLGLSDQDLAKGLAIMRSEYGIGDNGKKSSRKSIEKTGFVNPWRLRPTYCSLSQNCSLTTKSVELDFSMQNTKRRSQVAWLVVSFSIGIVSWLTYGVLFRGYPNGGQNESPIGAVDSEQEVDLTVANPNHAPEDVVKLQVNSIRDATKDLSKLKICYSLASPANRSSTGPFSRFAELVMMPPYDRLATSSDWQLGKTFIDKNLAAVLVSTISNKGEVSGFRFFLQRQNFPQPECWLTEAVLYVPDRAEEFTVSPLKDADLKIE